MAVLQILPVDRVNLITQEKQHGCECFQREHGGALYGKQFKSFRIGRSTPEFGSERGNPAPTRALRVIGERQPDGYRCVWPEVSG
jgi:hypothetical protein